TKRYMELQMEELKATHEEEQEIKASTPKKDNTNYNAKNAEIAKMYEDAAEYEEDLRCFEEELEIVNANQLNDIAAILTKELPDKERNYAQEMQSVLIIAWTAYVEVEKTHPKEQLELIKQTDFSEIIEKFTTKFPDYASNFEKDVRDLLVKRWEMLIAIKKEHVKEELAEIKTTGLKPKYVKRIYEQVHGIK
ncbi:hypothetical protein N9X61_05110, partial [Sulfurimonas sp.]|nr:hypothetical protein [Sulfurimonas sp.]